MIKTILIVVLCSCCAMVGYLISIHMKRRKNLLLEIERAIDTIKNEISFKKKYLGQILNELNLSQEIKSLIRGEDQKTPFKDKEKELILDLFENLGKSDVDGEIEKLENAKLKFNNLAKEVSSVYEKNGKLSIKLGLLFSVALLIMLI